MGRRQAGKTYQGRDVITGFSAKLLLITKSYDILYIRHKVIGVRLQDNIDE